MGLCTLKCLQSKNSVIPHHQYQTFTAEPIWGLLALLIITVTTLIIFALLGENSGGTAGLADVPLSLVLDTIILPYTIYNQVAYGNLSDEVSCEVIAPTTIEPYLVFPSKEPIIEVK